MSTQTIVVPYHQVSPVHLPRRDLVLGAADCLLLRVTVVHTDDPNSLALTLTGGIGGPACRLFVFSERGNRAWDYGAPPASPLSTLWAGTGVIATDAAGSFDFDIGTGAFAQFPLRCGWSLQLDWDGGTHTQLLAHGMLHFSRTAMPVIPPIFVVDDTGNTFTLA